MLRRRDCYEPDPDPSLPHQLQLRWEGLTIVAFCNCSRRVGTFKPERGDVAALAKARYDKHIDEVMKKQAELHSSRQP